MIMPVILSVSRVQELMCYRYAIFVPVVSLLEGPRILVYYIFRCSTGKNGLLEFLVVQN